MRTILKNSLTGLAVAGSVGIGTIASSALAANATSTTTQSAGYSSIVDKLATKFNLNKDEVKQVFDEDRAARQAEHQQRLEDSLSQAVKDGKLSETQKQELLTKLDAMHDDSTTTKPDSSAVKQKKDELDAWAKTQNIDLSSILPQQGRHIGPRPMTD